MAAFYYSSLSHNSILVSNSPNNVDNRSNFHMNGQGAANPEVQASMPGLGG